MTSASTRQHQNVSIKTIYASQPPSRLAEGRKGEGIGGYDKGEGSSRPGIASLPVSKKEAGKKKQESM